MGFLPKSVRRQQQKARARRSVSPASPAGEAETSPAEAAPVFQRAPASFFEAALNIARLFLGGGRLGRG